MRVAYVLLFASLLSACSGSGTTTQRVMPTSSGDSSHTLSSSQSGLPVKTFPPSQLVGKTATAFFDSTSRDGCVDTSVGLLGSQFSVANPPFVVGGAQHGPVANLFISQFNQCTETEVFFGFGFTTNATVNFDQNFASASVTATIPVLDQISGNTVNASVNMGWTETGNLTQAQHFNFQIHTATCFWNGEGNGAVRNATASGTVAIGTTNLTPLPSPEGGPRSATLQRTVA